MKVSKTVSIDIDLLQRTLQSNEKFSEIVSLALENYLFFQRETEEGNMIYYTRNFKTKIPVHIIWSLINFNNIPKWHKMINKVEYPSDFKMQKGAKCKLYGKIGDIVATSEAEIIEYSKNERFVYRAQGDFTIVSSISIRSVGNRNEINAIAVIGLSRELASKELYHEIYSNLDSAFGLFIKIATTLS